jgi:hypothetical protein
MNRKAFVILAVLQGACSAGPDQAKNYHGPSVTLTVHLADPPAVEVGYAEISVDAVDYCTPTYSQRPDVQEIPGETIWVSPWAGETAQVHFLAGGGSHCPAGTFYGQLRFFRVSAYLSVQEGPDSSTGAGTWAPIGYDLVYAQIPTTFGPYGPSGPSVAIPKGYSWLRRACGAAAGEVEMTVVSTDETVDFHNAGFNSPREKWTIQLSEQALVESCGETVPPADLGSRVSFDRAQSLVWSGDGASIDYLAPADPSDPSQSVGLRQLRLADGTTSELVAIPFGQGLQSDNIGKLYVGGAGNLLQVDASSTPAILTAIPASPYGVLSPNGRWLEYGGQHVWDLQSGVDVLGVDVFGVDGFFVGWSPDSSLAYRTDSLTLSTLSPATPDQRKTYGTLGDPYSTVAWSTEGPLLAHRPVAWSIQSGTNPACNACFGLSLQDPVTGAERPVLDASAGMIDIVPTRPLLGFMLVWARTCLGLYNTVCSYALIRVDLADATARQVAVSPNEVPVAVSPDNLRIALATASGIYVKSLAP